MPYLPGKKDWNLNILDLVPMDTPINLLKKTYKIINKYNLLLNLLHI